MDLIDRQAAIDILKNYISEENEPIEEGFYDGIETAIKNIEQLPSAQRTGRWIDAQYPFSKCDQCGAYMDTVNNEANYCCVCGAKMEVEHETQNT